MIVHVSWQQWPKYVFNSFGQHRILILSVLFSKQYQQSHNSMYSYVKHNTTLLASFVRLAVTSRRCQSSLHVRVELLDLVVDDVIDALVVTQLAGRLAVSARQRQTLRARLQVGLQQQRQQHSVTSLKHGDESASDASYAYSIVTQQYCSCVAVLCTIMKPPRKA